MTASTAVRPRPRSTRRTPTSRSRGTSSGVRPGPGRTRRALRRLIRLSTVLIIGLPLFALGATAAGVAALLYGDLPGTVPEANDRVVAMPSVVTDSAGNPIGTFQEFELTVPIRPDDIPQVLEDAVVAAEDQNFWEHSGVDFEGLARAAAANFREREIVQGGSTITQQLVKNRYLSNERSFGRKLNEAVLAARIERDMSKDEILFEYLDTTYFGSGAYGVGAAAETYFRKPVSELTTSEAAILAGIIPSPSETNPRTDPWAAEERRSEVLRLMEEQGYLTIEERDAALAEQLWFAGLGEPDRPATVYYPPMEADDGPYPFFLDYVRRYLVDRYGDELVYRGGLRIQTTIDPGLQAEAEAAVAAELEGTAAPLEMALVSIDPGTGHVRALVGGRDWEASQVNLALGGSLGMQPGSSFKPFVLATAFERGFGPDTVYPAPGSWSVPGCAGEQCTVSNYDGSGYGALTLDSATRSSVNTVYAELIFDLGPSAVAETARRLGISTLDPDREYGVSLALGSAEVSPLDMASAYGVFANHGERVAPTPVLRVVDADGAVLEDNTETAGEQVMNAAVADTVTDVLTGVITSGTGTSAEVGRPAAGKTGTAEEYRAAWFVGYTPQLSTAVWLGYSDEPRELRDIGGYGVVTGGTLPAHAWATFMAAAHESWPVVEFLEPGPLPVPPGTLSIEPGARRYAEGLPTGCGGLCDRPAPSTDADEPDDEDDDDEADGGGDGRAEEASEDGDTTTTTSTGADDD